MDVPLSPFYRLTDNFLTIDDEIIAVMGTTISFLFLYNLETLDPKALKEIKKNCSLIESDRFTSAQKR